MKMPASHFTLPLPFVRADLCTSCKLDSGNEASLCDLDCSVEIFPRLIINLPYVCKFVCVSKDSFSSH